MLQTAALIALPSIGKHSRQKRFLGFLECLDGWHLGQSVSPARCHAFPPEAGVLERRAGRSVTAKVYAQGAPEAYQSMDEKKGKSSVYSKTYESLSVGISIL